MDDSTTTASRAPVNDSTRTTTSRPPANDGTTTGRRARAGDRPVPAPPTTTDSAGGPPPETSGEGPPASPEPVDLRRLGLAAGDRVRWRDRRSSRWREGRVIGIERDGSVGVRDARGASRALRVDRLEVRDRGPRGGVVWEPLPERVARTEQLGLWRDEETEAPPTRA